MCYNECMSTMNICGTKYIHMILPVIAIIKLFYHICSLYPTYVPPFTHQTNIISGTYRKQLPYHNLDHLPYIYQAVHKVIVTYSLLTPLTIDISHTVSITTYFTSLAIINPSEFQWTSQYPKKHTLPTLPVGFPWKYRIQLMCGITFFPDDIPTLWDPHWWKFGVDSHLTLVFFLP